MCVALKSHAWKHETENMKPKSAVFLHSTEKTMEPTNRKAKSCKHEWELRAYMTESIQSEIVMLSIAYMLFAPTDNRKAYKAK